MEEFEKFYNKALKFLSYRPRSEKEVRERLRIKNHESGIKELDSIIDQVIHKLRDYNFINDYDFAKRWVESRMKSKQRSLRLIKLELKRKGISDDIIQTIIHDSKFMIHSDLEQAKKLVEKRIGRLKGLDRQKIYEKLGRYLASKGFDWDTIKKSIDEILNKGV